MHRGHAAVLEALCAASREVVVVVGSANRYDWRNPFTLRETRMMIEMVITHPCRVQILGLDDVGDGPRWRQLLLEAVGPVEAVFTANPYVWHLLVEHVPVRHPVSLLPLEERLRVEGAMVRRLMAEGRDWQDLVPPPVARLVEERGLAERFRREFGLETLARTLMDVGRKDVLVE